MEATKNVRVEFPSRAVNVTSVQLFRGEGEKIQWRVGRRLFSNPVGKKPAECIRKEVGDTRAVRDVKVEVEECLEPGI